MENKTIIKFLNTLHLALCIGLLTFAIIAYTLEFNLEEPVPNSHKLTLIVSLLGTASVMLSFWLPSRLMDKLRQKKELYLQLSGLRNVLILKYILVEFPAFAFILLYLLTQELFLFIIGIGLIGLLYYFKPTFRNMMVWLKPDTVMEEQLKKAFSLKEAA